ncbi:MAG: hypothetical protein AB1486_13775 [Planctomycetota bacterium]
MKRLFLIGVGLLVLVTVLALVASELLKVQLDVFLHSKVPRAESPELYLVPQEWRPAAVSTGAGSVAEATAGGTKIRFGGYELEVPWGAIKDESLLDNAIDFAFENGGRVRAVELGESVRGEAGFESEESVTDATGAHAAEKGEEEPGTPAFFEAILSASPEKISFFMPREQALEQAQLLAAKKVLVPRGTDAIYRVSTDSCAALLFTDEDRGSAVLLLFGEGGAPLEVTFEAPAGKPLEATELQTAIRTLRRAP